MDTNYIERNRESQQRLRRLVERLSDDDLLRPLPDGWIIADTLAHLAFYDRRAAILLRRFAQEGVFASPYDYDTINEGLPHLTRLIPPRAAAHEAIAAATAADEAAAATAETLIPEIRRLNQVKLDRSEHRNTHLNDIEALVPPQS